MIPKLFYAKSTLLTKLQFGFMSILFILSTHSAISQTQDKQTVQDSTEDNKIHLFVEEMPIFPGNINTWIYNNIHYPESAKEKKIEGKVYVRFVIEKDGSVSNVKIIRGVSPELDNEAKDVISSMPKWYPGKQNNTPVRVLYTVPVYFALRSTSPSVERRTFERYLKVLNTEEEKLKNGLDTVPQASFDMYCLYLKKRYGSDKAAYKGIITSARDQQQSSEIMLSIVMPTMSLPASDKNKILQFYKEEWDEQIRLIDSLPTENFITEYVKITPVSEQTRHYANVRFGTTWEKRNSKDTLKIVSSIRVNSSEPSSPIHSSGNGKRLRKTVLQPKPFYKKSISTISRSIAPTESTELTKLLMDYSYQNMRPP